MRFGIRAIAERDGKRQEGSSGGGGRTTLGYFDGKSPEYHAKLAAEQAIRMLDAQEAPAGTMEVVLAPGDSGILLHEAVGHGLEADFNRKGTSNYTGQIGQRRRERALHRRRRRDAPPVARQSSTSTTKATSRSSSVLIENGKLRGYMHDRTQREVLQAAARRGNGRRESFACAPMPRMTNTILSRGRTIPRRS